MTTNDDAGTPEPAAAPPPPPPPPPPPAPWRRDWKRPRVGPRTLIIAAVTLVLGCCIGAGLTAVAGAVFHHGPRDGHHDRYDRPGRYDGDRRDRPGPRGWDDRRNRPPAQPANPPTQAPPAVTPPAPSAS